jgi:arylsulfatase A-like enzyme
LLKAEGLPQALLDSRRVFGMQPAEHAVDELLFDRDDVRYPHRARVPQADRFPMRQWMVAGAGPPSWGLWYTPLIEPGISTPALRRTAGGQAAHPPPRSVGGREGGIFLLLVLAALAGLLAGCRLPAGVIHLRFENPQMNKVGDEARPSRRMPVGNEARWTIPANIGGILEVAYGCPPGWCSSRGGGHYRILRSYRGSSQVVGDIPTGPSGSPRWVETDFGWLPTDRPETLTIQFEAAASAGLGPLLAEPILRPANEESGRKDVLVFLIDTLRADGLSCYSRDGAPTPEIDRLAAQGLRVERVLSPVNWTLPAHASLFTSASVSKHQVGLTRSTLGSRLPTLAEVLAKKGYRTLAVTNGGYVDPAFGIARGFDRYLTIDVRKNTIEANLKAALGLLRRYQGEPTFLFFHTYEVHEYPRKTPPHPPARTMSERLLNVAHARAVYRRLTSRVDTAFGELRRGLEDLKLAGRTMIVVTADHGEMFYEHPAQMGNFIGGHGQPFLYDQELRVPLILYDPRNPASGSVLQDTASLIDVAPTILDALGAKPPPSFEGLPLEELRSKPSLARDRLFVSESPAHRVVALERGRIKLILRPLRRMYSMWATLREYPELRTVEAYDIANDPREDHPLAPMDPRVQALERNAAGVLASNIPGSLLIRLPPERQTVEASVTYTSGVAAADLYGAKWSDSIDTADGGRGVQVHVLSQGGDAWFTAAPDRPRDAALVRLEVPRGLPVVIGDGIPMASTDARLSWGRLSARNGQPPAGCLLVLAGQPKGLSPEESESKASSPELVMQLRSLGYVGTAALGASPNSEGPGGRPGEVRIIVSRSR